MNGIFWGMTAFMTAVALVFVLGPVLARGRRLSPVLIVAMIAVPAIALALYKSIGSPRAVEASSAAERGAMEGGPPKADQRNVASVSSLLQGLEDRLAKEPDDGGGWLLLAKSYQHLGRTDDAKAAYAKAVSLGKPDSAFEASLGKAGPGKADSNASVSISGDVSIDPELAENLDPEATVFVIAKAVGGPPMPLAVVRKSVKDLPFEFVLDDGDAMVGGMTLSNAGQVVISAKISSAGDAMRMDEGIEAASRPIVLPTAETVRLRISKSEQD